MPGSSSRPPVGQRAFALQRLDLGAEQLVVHGARLKSKVGSRSSRSRSFRAVAAPASARSRDLRLAGHQSSGSPRNICATTAILR